MAVIRMVAWADGITGCVGIIQRVYGHVSGIIGGRDYIDQEKV